MDYLIFGRYAGECFGDDCVRIYKLSQQNVWEDQNHQYPVTTSHEEQFDFVQLPNTIFQLVDGLIEQFPDELKEESSDIIGCPDCHDQGGYYIQISQNGSSNQWTIDTEKNVLPTYLHDFVEQLSEKLILLNQ